MPEVAADARFRESSHSHAASRRLEKCDQVSLELTTFLPSSTASLHFLPGTRDIGGAHGGCPHLTDCESCHLIIRSCCSGFVRTRASVLFLCFPLSGVFRMRRVCLAAAVAAVVPIFAARLVADDFQYQFQDIQIPKATADEPVRGQLSTAAAGKYLEQASLAWSGQRNCVSCHTNGTYMTIRPALTPTLGAPNTANRTFFLEQMAKLKEQPVDRLKQSTRPAQVIYIAAGLAEWDAHVTGSLSSETSAALELMFSIQTEEGTWGTLDCWPPFESDAWHEATVAAMAAAAAPGWLEAVRSSTDRPHLKAAVEKLEAYLRSDKAPHDYGRVLQLWAAARMPQLLDDARRQQLVEMLWKHQRPDGSWSIRSFAAPEAWGSGNRAARLRAEADLENPAGDGHMTGLAVIVLREHNIAADDPRLQKAISWLSSNQRESGRWWTRSLNTDSWHFITYSGTAYPLLALQMCNAVPVAAK
jgi:squalene-hopene/tetraprenyl-beta-curcumene cyclase